MRTGSVPEGAVELGTIEARNIRWNELLGVVKQFQAEAAKLGGDYAKIDEIRMTWGSTETTTTTHIAEGAPLTNRPAVGPMSEKGQEHTSQSVTVGTTLIGRAFRTSQP